MGVDPRGGGPLSTADPKHRGRKIVIEKRIRGQLALPILDHRRPLLGFPSCPPMNLADFLLA